MVPAWRRSSRRKIWSLSESMLTLTCWSIAAAALDEFEFVEAALGVGWGEGGDFFDLLGVIDFAGFTEGARSAEPSATTTCLRVSRIAPIAKRAASPPKRYHLKSSSRLGAAVTSGPVREFPSWALSWPPPVGCGVPTPERLTES